MSLIRTRWRGFGARVGAATLESHQLTVRYGRSARHLPLRPVRPPARRTWPGRAVVMRIEPPAASRPLQASIADTFGPAPRPGSARFACVGSAPTPWPLPVDPPFLTSSPCPRL